VEALAGDRGLEVGTASQSKSSLRLRQPLAALAPPVAEHACAAAGAHPPQEAMDSPTVSFLGLVGAFDRASVPEAFAPAPDTEVITSSCAERALRYPQVGVIVPARKQIRQRIEAMIQYENRQTA
jgi:hypothetical protein